MNIIKNQDYIGNIYGFWTIKSISDKKVENHTYFICECVCGNIKEIRKTLLLNNKTKSCGCNGLHNIKGNKYGRLTVLCNGYKKDNRIWVKVKCECGNEKEVLKQSLISGFTKSCGCLNLEERPLKRKENHPRWNPSLTEEDRKNNESRGSAKGYQSFRRKVLKLYNNTCICCGYKANKNMRVHHKDSWNSNKEKRYDINNAVVLCENCHDIQYKYSFHNLYRNGNNTKEQLEEYIQRYKSDEFDDLIKRIS